jgi:hypothetical protein
MRPAYAGRMRLQSGVFVSTLCRVQMMVAKNSLHRIILFVIEQQTT